MTSSVTAVFDIVDVTTREKDRWKWIQPEHGRGWVQRDKRHTKTRVFFFPRGETIMENFLSGRFNRPYDLYRMLLPEVYRRSGLYIAGMMPSVKAYWSQRAGCSCPCSPGFIIDFVAGYDVFVTVSQSEDAQSMSFPKEESA
jgi:hypothetical protein